MQFVDVLKRHRQLQPSKGQPHPDLIVCRARHLKIPCQLINGNAKIPTCVPKVGSAQNGVEVVGLVIGVKPIERELR